MTKASPLTVPQPEAGQRPAGTPPVVVCHPGRQHTYETVLAAQEAGLLRAFATAVFVRDDDLLAGLARRVSHLPLAGPIARSARARMNGSLDPGLVRSFPAYPVAGRALRRLPRGAAVERWGDRRCDAAIARWLRSLEPPPQIVHGFEGSCLAALRAAKELGATTVLDVPNAHEVANAVLEQEGGRPAPPGLTRRVQEERTLADFLLVPSEHVAGCLVEHGVPSDRLLMVPYGADVGRFAPADERPDDIFRALFVGNVSLRKGVRYLLEAWRRLGLSGAELVLVGPADRDGRELLNRYRGVARWVGQVPRDGVDRWFKNSDVFVFPSLCEGSALVTYEAMASGLPVITTRASGSVVRDGVDGFLVPERDCDALAGRILYLFRNPPARRELGACARELIAARYTWLHYQQRIAAAYRLILSTGTVQPTRGAPQETHAAD